MSERSGVQLIEQVLPTYQFSERHSLSIRAEPGRIMERVESVLQQTDPLVNRVIALREAPARIWHRLGGRSQLPSRPFGFGDFTRLGSIDKQELVFGLAGLFWQADYGLHSVADAQAFASLQGVPKLVMNFHAVATGSGSQLSTCTRVYCPDPSSLYRFMPYWYLIRPVSGLIRRRLLRQIASVVEQH